MISMPPTLTPTKYPGYYWCVETKRLFSIKVGGVLREIRKKRVPHFAQQKYNLPEYTYCISHNGSRRYLHEAYVRRLELKDHEVPYGK